MQSFFRPIHPAGSVILCHKGGHGLHESRRNQHNEATDFFCHSHTGRGRHAHGVDDGQYNEGQVFSPDQEPGCCHAHGLSHDCRNRRSHRPHAEDRTEEKIAENIEYTGDGHRDERRVGIS